MALTTSMPGAAWATSRSSTALTAAFPARSSWISCPTWPTRAFAVWMATRRGGGPTPAGSCRSTALIMARLACTAARQASDEAESKIAPTDAVESSSTLPPKVRIFSTIVSRTRPRSPGHSSVGSMAACRKVTSRVCQRMVTSGAATSTTAGATSGRGDAAPGRAGGRGAWAG